MSEATVSGLSIAAALAVSQEASRQAAHPRREETPDELARRGCAYARDLAAGQVIYHGGAILGDDGQFMIIEQRPVLVIHGPEPAADFFGRSGHFRWWCRDQLAGREGWWPFGPGGVIRTEPQLPYAPLAVKAAERELDLIRLGGDAG